MYVQYYDCLVHKILSCFCCFGTLVILFPFLDFSIHSWSAVIRTDRLPTWSCRERACGFPCKTRPYFVSYIRLRMKSWPKSTRHQPSLKCCRVSVRPLSSRFRTACIVFSALDQSRVFICRLRFKRSLSVSVQDKSPKCFIIFYDRYLVLMKIRWLNNVMRKIRNSRMK